MAVRREIALERVHRVAYLVIRARLARKAGRMFHLRESRLSRTSCLSRSQFTSNKECTGESGVAAEAFMSYASRHRVVCNTERTIPSPISHDPPIGARTRDIITNISQA
jgi:hypothetical protein